MSPETSAASAEWFARARRVMPGGVNSPVRAFNAVGGTPPFIDAAEGAYLRTVDGTELVDFIASWGALILGHSDPRITGPVVDSAGKGTSFGLPTAAEVELAELICRLVPSIDVVRMVNSGTEATASALRIARAHTGRAEVLKFEGCYHGHSDAFLVQAGSGMATFGTPSSPGVPEGSTATTRVARYNDLESVENHLSAGDVAAVIVEPVAGNMGCVPPLPGFLDGLRRLCDEHGALLIFDEVMTGFRVSLGGAQERYGVTPDLTALGKVVAGGSPGAAYGGREELMRLVSPDGPVYQAGTLAGNPLVTAAGLATLRQLEGEPELYERLEQAGRTFADRLTDVLEGLGVPGVAKHAGGMIGLFLGVEEATNWDEVSGVDQDWFKRFFHAALDRGVLVPPSPFESWFLMAAHTDGVMEKALDALAAAVEESAP